MTYQKLIWPREGLRLNESRIPENHVELKDYYDHMFEYYWFLSVIENKVFKDVPSYLIIDCLKELEKRNYVRIFILNDKYRVGITRKGFRYLYDELMPTIDKIETEQVCLRILGVLRRRGLSLIGLEVALWEQFDISSEILDQNLKHLTDLKYVNWDEGKDKIEITPLGIRAYFEKNIKKKELIMEKKIKIPKISGGVIATLNVDSEVRSISNNIIALQNSGNKDIARVFKKLTEEIANNKEIQDDTKVEMVEQIEELSNQAQLPPEKRKSGLITLYNNLSTSLVTIVSIASIWSVWGDKIAKFFGL